MITESRVALRSASSPLSESSETTIRPTTGAPVPRPQKSSIRRRTPRRLARTRSSPVSARAAIGRSANSLNRKAIAATTIEEMPTVKAVLSARAGCTTIAMPVKSTVAAAHSVACTLVRNHGTPRACTRCSRVGTSSREAHRSARSAPAVPQTVPTATATAT